MIAGGGEMVAASPSRAACSTTAVAPLVREPNGRRRVDVSTAARVKGSDTLRVRVPPSPCNRGTAIRRQGARND